MAQIDIQVSNLQKTSSEIESYDDLLINQYFPHMKNIINTLLGERGIKTEEVRSILQGIASKIEYYQTQIKNDLTSLEEGIAESLKGYVLSTEDLRNKLVSILNVMQNFVDGGTLDASQITSTGYMTEGSGDTEDVGEETLDDGTGASSDGKENDSQATYAESLRNDFFEKTNTSDLTDEKTFQDRAIEYSEQVIDNLKNKSEDTVYGPTIESFIEDYDEYKGNGVTTVRTYLNSDQGAKYRDFIVNYTEPGVKNDYVYAPNEDYLSIVNDPDTAFKDFINQAYYGELSNSTGADWPNKITRKYYNNLQDSIEDTILNS